MRASGDCCSRVRVCSDLLGRATPFVLGLCGGKCRRKSRLLALRHLAIEIHLVAQKGSAALTVAVGALVMPAQLGWPLVLP